ncbi:MAG: pyruvate, water dikinase [Deltaproteobacteria bacterium]|uniref:PEP/pyruvate-binding domain-containing protein n=1 Tax=Hydrosulfovibrio ferrireducens TaxID=2934181 RepID=UPI0012084704|nr:MAG: pyruvate, water dikinase [Deltaproteobacteria bacterium]
MLKGNDFPEQPNAGDQNMTFFLDRLTSLFRTKPRLKPAELQAAFRAHYKDFRALLTANNNALELMAEMEQALTAGRSFGMAFVRGNCTALSVNIYKMIHHLTRLADGRYSELDQPFRAITKQLEQVIALRSPSAEGALILTMAEVDASAVDQVGEKMANLGEVRNRLGLRTPDGFVITATASRHFIEADALQVEINRRLKGLNLDNLEELYTVSAGIQNLISNAPLSPELEEAILAHHQQLATSSEEELLVALRSSALGEDSSNVSFAGQYRTQLNVSREFVVQTYKEIVASKYKSQAIVYRQQRGYRNLDVHMCVGCLRMVDGAISGVLYSRAPDDPRSPYVIIQAAPGLAATVVDGSGATEQFRVSRTPPHPILHRQSAEELSHSPLALTELQAAELAATGVRLEEHFGTPQDIEWSIDRCGLLYILQSRPLGRPASEGGQDNSSISSHTVPQIRVSIVGRSVRQRGLPAMQQVCGQADDKGDAVPCDPLTLLSGGVCASQGVGCGPVFMVRSNLDLLRFPKGAVLVIETPYPDWASLLNRAVAVVSETGQPAAHLATVAREFGVPAIFGMKQALATLENNSLVTVDATGGKVYAGRIESLLALAPPKPNLMAGSPVYKVLTQALAHITPLNLTDPASPFFRPDGCKTLHDLTRFCHEKAVVEMFTFGERYGFDDKAAKQLVVDAPSQWWVIDLDDGFTPDFDPESRYIDLNHITSAPMQAIWQGMTAFPWAGPPPVSLGGFGSIIFQSTRNPNLDPAVRSAMAAKNYFLISKNFCNLSVRLGYHFALVEANLGKYLTENYVSFQFKGGAADQDRRLLRIQLISEILSEFGFRVEQKVDAMTARIEKKPGPYLLERLKVLGYLLIHTRQIDMIMADQDMAASYHQKIMADLRTLMDKTTPEA